MLNQRQLLMLDILTQNVPGFRVMRRLPVQFQGLLRCGGPAGLSRSITDAKHLGIHAMRVLQRPSGAMRLSFATQSPIPGAADKLKVRLVA
jgi:hypothetical protein